MHHSELRVQPSRAFVSPSSDYARGTTSIFAMIEFYNDMFCTLLYVYVNATHTSIYVYTSIDVYIYIYTHS